MLAAMLAAMLVGLLATSLTALLAALTLRLMKPESARVDQGDASNGQRGSRHKVAIVCDDQRVARGDQLTNPLDDIA